MNVPVGLAGSVVTVTVEATKVGKTGVNLLEADEEVGKVMTSVLEVMKTSISGSPRVTVVVDAGPVGRTGTKEVWLIVLIGTIVYSDISVSTISVVCWIEAY
jgi:hypothetical protein